MLVTTLLFHTFAYKCYNNETLLRLTSAKDKQMIALLIAPLSQHEKHVCMYTKKHNENYAALAHNFLIFELRTSNIL